MVRVSVHYRCVGTLHVQLYRYSYRTVPVAVYRYIYLLLKLYRSGSVSTALSHVVLSTSCIVPVRCYQYRYQYRKRCSIL